MLSKSFIGLSMAVAMFSSASAQTFSEAATCKLTNTAANAALYEGPCTVVQSQGGGNNTVFSVKMGSSEPFMFAGVRGEATWMHGPDRVHFTDLPNGGIFHWSTYALVVAE